MSFFNKSQNEDLSEQWRRKYLNLFDEQNKIEHTHREKEKFLRQFSIQLSILAEGHDKNADAILLRVREYLKREIDANELKIALKTFVESVKNLPQKKEKLKADLLFDFLLREYPDSAQQNALRELKKQVNSDDTTIEQATDLFIEILKIIHPPEPETEIKLAGEEESVEDVLNAHPIFVDVRIVTEQLQEYLSSLVVPEMFKEQAVGIKTALLNPEQSPQSFEDVLDNLVRMLIEIKEFGEAEQKDIDQFLLHIAAQLSELNTIVTQTTKAANATTKSRNKLDQSVFIQIRELQVEAIKTTSIDSLKDMVNQCFKTIATEIKNHHQQDKEQQQAFQDRMAELINKMISLEVETETLKAELKVVHAQNLHDTLTGLYNRNAYNQRLKDEVARYKRYLSPLSIAIWDIDHFKNINDTFGHKSGDKVLALTAKQLQEHTRDTDFIARFGGEEFVMLLPNTSKDAGLFLAEQLRELIQKTGFNSNGQAVPITISCGLTELLDGDTEDSFFERADKALYEAKNNGRNQCVAL
jgi:diguanylate cyclase